MSTTSPTPPSASSRIIRAGSLSPEAFAPFGEVVQNPATHDALPSHVGRVRANQGTATKWVDVAHMRDYYHLSPSRKTARCVVNMFVCEPRRLTEQKGDSGVGAREVFPLRVLERHPFTPQMFVPMGVSAGDTNVRYLVIVAPTLPVKSTRDSSQLLPPYPTPESKRKRSLKERLLGARPNPFTNDYSSSTTPLSTEGSTAPIPKGPGAPDLDNVKAFIARGDQAVTYGPGTWHAPMVVLGEKTIDFVVVQYASGVASEDCQEVEVVTADGEGALAIDLTDTGALKAKL